MNEERHEKKAYWLVIMRPQFLTGGDTKGLCSALPDGRAELLGFSCCQIVEQWFFRVVKEVNNEKRWRVPDRIDRVM
jgi:hypothetical protein